MFNSTGDYADDDDVDALDEEIIAPSQTLYVSNLPYNATGATLKTAFEGCENANVVMDSVTGRSKG